MKHAAIGFFSLICQVTNLMVSHRGKRNKEVNFIFSTLAVLFAIKGAFL